MGSVVAMTLGAVPQAGAVDGYAYSAHAGGTYMTAVGTTVGSDYTAESSIAGYTPGQDSNQVASFNATNLANIGAINTDVAATPSGAGWKTVSHARTATVNLFNGLVRATAVDTTTTAVVNGTSAPTATSHTQFASLTISGKTYPATVPSNTGITVPGVATVALNAIRVSTTSDAVIVQGAGLVVTLLAARNGIPAGAQIWLNPTYSVIQPRAGVGGATLGGVGYGAYIFSRVGDQIQARTGRLGAKPMPTVGTNDQVLSNTTGRVTVNGVLGIQAIESTVRGISSPVVNEATVTNKVTGLQLFPQLLGSVISARVIGSSAHVRVQGEEATEEAITEGSFHFLDLKIAGRSIAANVAPNTQIKVANLGLVTLNKRTAVRQSWVHSYEVIGLHVVLDTARAGLPVGTEIEVGVSRAIVWD